MKFCMAMIIIILATFGMFFYIHESEISNLREELDNTLAGRASEISAIGEILDDRINDNRLIEAEKQKIRENVIRAAKEVVSSSGANRTKTPQEAELVKLLKPRPTFTDSKTKRVWDKLGPFPLEKLLDDGKIKLDTRLIYSSFKTGKRKYEGQMLPLGLDHEHGVSRIEWKSGDIYEGENINGYKDGYGRYIWRDGSHYIGGWKGGRLDGIGLYQFTNGRKMIGTFRSGKFIG